ncbi:MAG: response regulator, partial [Coleofasciculus sp. C2-GNP5-27]
MVDDHEAVLDGTVNLLTKQYPEADVITAQTARGAQQQVEGAQPDLAILDLSIPEQPGDMARTETGIQLLRTLMEQYPTLNIVVQSAHVRSLVRLKPAIST